MKDAFSGCHPILNFFYFGTVLTFTMFVQHPVFLLISFVGAVIYGVVLNGWKRVLRMNLLGTLPGLLIVTLLNPAFNHYGVTPLLYLENSGNWVTLEALVYGLVLGSILFIMILWFSCYNHVMTSDKFIYLFGRIIPAMSLILSMSLRFVPEFIRRLDVIRSGQKCIGRDISNAGLIRKVKYGLNMFSILVTWALENAIETADSMKSRGYGLKGRTAFSVYHFDKRDRFAGMALLSLFCIVLYGCLRGAAFADYNPRILLAGMTVQGRKAPADCPLSLSIVTFASFTAFCLIPPLIDLSEKYAFGRSRKEVGKEISVTYREIYKELAGEKTE